MGSGSLGSEIAQLASVLAEVGLSPRDTLSLHLEQVEHLVSGLGNRSSRHVMSRADLLALELVIHIGECYQQAVVASHKQSTQRGAAAGDKFTQGDNFGQTDKRSVAS
jgi:hypothetical protein